jgi:hypothetical protein
MYFFHEVFPWGLTRRGETMSMPDLTCNFKGKSQYNILFFEFAQKRCAERSRGGCR